MPGLREPRAGVRGRALASDPRVLRALGALALLALLAAMFALAADAASAPSRYVPARSGGWPGWLAGPLAGAGSTLSSGAFQALLLTVSGCYLLILASVRALPARAVWAAIVAAHAIMLLGPPLISQDVFGYVSFARLGALHGLDPYSHFAAEAGGDHVFPFLGWPFEHSPYGPLFTLASYLLAPLTLAASLWALKALAVLSSLAAIWLTSRAAARIGRSPLAAAAFVGLNPVLVVLAVGGAHNDTLLIASIALALALSAGAAPRTASAAGALVAGIGVKFTAGLLLPFLVLGARRGERVRVTLLAATALLALLALAVAGFGLHALGFLGAVGEQQQMVATHSIPAETARWLGLQGTPHWWRGLFQAGFVVVLATTLWRTARGRCDWRDGAAWATLALLVATAWLLPWYVIWLLPLAAVSGERRLRAAVLLACAYAVLIHLPLADAVLSPPHGVTAADHAAAARLIHAVGPVAHRIEFSRLEVLGHDALDLGF